MKRYISLILVSLFAMTALAGCGGAKEESKAPAAAEQPKTEEKAESKTPTLDKIKAEGKLVIGTSPDYPPYESLDEKNNVIGFDIDLMQEVANKLGVKLEIVQINFDGLIPGLLAKKFDIMAAGVSVTEERMKTVDFTVPYMAGTQAVVVHKESTATVTKLEDLVGKQVAVQLGTIQSDAVKEIAGIKVKEYNLFTEAAQAVASKQADAMYVAKPVADAFVKNDPNLKLAAEMGGDDTALALRKDTPDLTEYVSGVITELKANGKYDQMIKKWFN